jgi:hypothetical protein
MGMTTGILRRLVMLLTTPSGPRQSCPHSVLLEHVLGHRPWRVFLSHTSDLRRHPAERSFVAAAEAAVVRAGHAVADMEYFPARDADCASHCTAMVASADVYVGIAGARYGALVPGTGRSFTELEFETATALGLPRLVFVVCDDACPECDARQLAFRRRLCQAGLLVCHVTSPADLELRLLHALDELRAESLLLATCAAAIVATHSSLAERGD